MRTIGNWAFYGCQNLTDLNVSMMTKDIRDDAFCGCENVYNVHITEFDKESVTNDEIKKGHRITLKILKQINKNKAERYAREHNISMLFI